MSQRTALVQKLLLAGWLALGTVVVWLLLAVVALWFHKELTFPVASKSNFDTGPTGRRGSLQYTSTVRPSIGGRSTDGR